MYCACCKNFEEVEYNPLENIGKFMKFIKNEQAKMEPKKQKKRPTTAERR